MVPLDPPSNLSLAPAEPPTQQQRLATMQERLPLLTIMERTPAASTSVLAGKTSTHRVHSPHDSRTRYGASGTGLDVDAGGHGIAAASTYPAPAGSSTAAGITAAGITAVVFLANTSGSPAYAVGSDSAVHIMRGA